MKTRTGGRVADCNMPFVLNHPVNVYVFSDNTICLQRHVDNDSIYIFCSVKSFTTAINHIMDVNNKFCEHD